MHKPKTRRPATFTSDPDTPAPQLPCPACNGPLAYRQTVFNGVKPVERWDYLECRTCGIFEYRQRTRKLRSATSGVPFLRHKRNTRRGW